MTGRPLCAMADGFSLKVNSVADALNKDECKIILYLCSDLLEGRCVEDLRGALVCSASQARTRAAQSRPEDAVLMELVFRVKRFDILKKVLGTSRENVEALLKQGSVVSEYRVLMVELSENLEAEELRSLMFLLSSNVPKGQLEKATSFLDVVVELEKMDEVSCERLQLIEHCLKNIRRADLLKKIQSYQRGLHLPQASPCSVQNGAQLRPGRNHCHQTAVAVQQQQCQAFQNLKLSVPESTAQHQQASVDQYYINPERRGMCVIIDCIGCDGDLMERTFRQLGFQVSLHSLLGMSEVRSLLLMLSQNSDLQRASAFVCCLLSRSSNTHLLATDACGPGLPLVELRQLFNAQRCPLLAGKPKLFFTQSYGCADATPGPLQHDPQLETDGVPRRPTAARETLPTDADVLWSLCEAQAGVLERRGHTSVYLQALSSALTSAHERSSNILDALTEVNRHVSEHNQRNLGEKYELTISHTLRKILYL